MNRSFGERPVNSPVSIARAPVSVSIPSPVIIQSSINSEGERFQNCCPKPDKPIDFFKSLFEPNFPINSIV